jgi:hypothetical protein
MRYQMEKINKKKNDILLGLGHKLSINQHSLYLYIKLSQLDI